MDLECLLLLFGLSVGHEGGKGMSEPASSAKNHPEVFTLCTQVLLQPPSWMEGTPQLNAWVDMAAVPQGFR